MPLLKGYYQSPRWSQEINDCSMPMTFDTYSNCSYNCLYCFSQYQRAIGGAKKNYLANKVKAVNIERIKRMFTLQEKSQFSDFIEQRKVMQWGGLSDPFDEFERQYGKTLELLRFFREIEYPICFSTKATWWLYDDRYVDLVRGADFWNCKFSIITLDEEKARFIERGTPTPKERIEAIEIYSKLNNGGATLRLRPFIIGVSNPSYLELIKLAGGAGATALSTEFFCMELRTPAARPKYEWISELVGFDMVEFYRKYSVSAGYLRLNRNVKRPFIDAMENLCNEIGMRFYVSDAHFKERCANGSCCGLPADWNYSRGQFAEALQIAKSNGRVYWSDIAPDLEYSKKFEWSRAVGYNATSSERHAKYFGFTMFDFLHWCWNNPKSGQSPYGMFEGIIKPVDWDANGDVVYEWDESRA